MTERPGALPGVEYKAVIGLLINLLILVLVFGVAWWIVTLLPLPPPFGLVAQVVLALILLIILINFLLGGSELGWRAPLR